MGKGDRKTKKGKVWRHSTGNCRPKHGAKRTDLTGAKSSEKAS